MVDDDLEVRSAAALHDMVSPMSAFVRCGRDRRSPGLTRFYRRVVHRRLQPDAPFRFREMAISGARLQLGIAPAGTGKTTALRALATAWRQSGGTVVGLAPSASAAAVLRDAGQPSLAVTLHGDKIRKRGRSTAAARETRASLSARRSARRRQHR